MPSTLIRPGAAIAITPKKPAVNAANTKTVLARKPRDRTKEDQRHRAVTAALKPRHRRDYWASNGLVEMQIAGSESS